MSREDLKGCNLYKSKPLEYQTKKDYVQEGIVYTGLDCWKGLQVSLRWLYVGIDCGVYNTWKVMIIKFSVDQSIFV